MCFRCEMDVGSMLRDGEPPPTTSLSPVGWSYRYDYMYLHSIHIHRCGFMLNCPNSARKGIIAWVQGWVESRIYVGLCLFISQLTSTRLPACSAFHQSAKCGDCRGGSHCDVPKHLSYRKRAFGCVWVLLSQ